MNCYTLKKIFGRNRLELKYNLAFFFHHNLSFIFLYSFLSFAFPFCLSLILLFTYTPFVTCFRTLSGSIKYHSIKKDHLHHAPVLSACITGPGRGMDILSRILKTISHELHPRSLRKSVDLSEGNEVFGDGVRPTGSLFSQGPCNGFTADEKELTGQ